MDDDRDLTCQNTKASTAHPLIVPPFCQRYALARHSCATINRVYRTQQPQPSPAGMGSGRRSGILGPAGISLVLSGSSEGRNSGGGEYKGRSSSLLAGCHTGWLGTRAGLTKSASRSGTGRVHVARGPPAKAAGGPGDGMSSAFSQMQAAMMHETIHL